MTKRQMHEAMDRIEAKLADYDGTDLEFIEAEDAAKSAIEAINPALYREVVEERLVAWQQAHGLR